MDWSRLNSAWIWQWKDGAWSDLSPVLARMAANQLDKLQATPDLPILLQAQDPIFYLGSVFAALISKRPIFIANPAWQTQEWKQVEQLLSPVTIWTDLVNLDLPSFDQAPRPKPGWIMIPTGGSSGQIQFAIHTQETMLAAIKSFQMGYGLNVIDSLNCLPLHHVSGLMPILRSFFTGGTVKLLPDWRTITQLPPDSIQNHILSLVPRQLQALLDSGQAIPTLQALQVILLGGGPSWQTLLEQARSQNLPLSPCYGMTETLGLIARIPVVEFQETPTAAYQVLPDVSLDILTPDPAGIGTIKLQTPALMVGYYPERLTTPGLITGDLGSLNGNQQLTLQGRQQRLIITGGEKVQPEEVEVVIQNTGLVEDVYVFGQADATWGEIVTAMYVPAGPGVTEAVLKAALAGQLSRYKHPQQWQAVTKLPRTPQGKLRYEQAQGLAKMSC
ncbi:acyl-CoA synthetase (AMP-forming)/AMP-acid ligase II [Synechococcus sp. PCC 6312]|nr:acyl-CoA synthetase (AMP-forming)/AMP-acid ligase II [Synechococcus sp. PCC 6312]